MNRIFFTLYLNHPSLFFIIEVNDSVIEDHVGTVVANTSKYLYVQDTPLHLDFYQVIVIHHKRSQLL